ncbi:MAG: multicopper oxidase domain-containing protein [Bacteroidota bacterium]|nr:multicopper oxidase domain-containing protein [Bacteroidota bacterium]
MRILFFVFSFFLAELVTAQNPLFIPPAMTGTTFNLTVQNGTTQFYPSVNTPTYGINGPLLAPTLILNKWDWVTMNVTNNLTGNGNSTTMHWHGIHLPAMDDGGPHQPIPQTTTWSPSFQVLNTAGTFWYHPHGEGKTDLHVSKGLAGMIIIKDSVEAGLTLPRTYGVDDFPLIVQTKSFDVLNQIAISTAYDTVPMVNGTVDAYLNAPAQVIRLRLLNGSSGRTFLFGFSNNMNFHLIATDGGLIDSTLTLNRLLLSNGERVEILVDLSALLNDTVFLMNYGSEIPNGIMGADSVGDANNQIPDYYDNFLNGADFNLLQLNVGAQTASPVTTLPVTLAALSPWAEAAATVNRRFEFDTLTEMFTMPNLAEGPFAINRTMFDMDSINEVVYLNDIEIWTLRNKTQVAHPFHIHDIQFYILDINGGVVPQYEQGQKDVVLVMPGDSVRFITKFLDFADNSVPYMYHCHVLHHEDEGMMGSFLVIDTTATSVQEFQAGTTMNVYPNPASDNFRIELAAATPGAPGFIYICNSLGQIVYASNAASLLQVDTHDWNNGLYVITVVQETKTVRGKIVINHQN